MAQDNPLWGEERIASELLVKLGHPGFATDGTQVHAEATGRATSERSNAGRRS
jgi:hypothetical protein